MKPKSSSKESPVLFWEEFLKVMNENSNLFRDVKSWERKYIHGLRGSGADWSQTITICALQRNYTYITKTRIGINSFLMN